MEITYSLKSFKNLLECLKANSDEFQVKVNENGINIIVVDNANISIFRSTINKTSFKNFDVEKNIEFGLNVNEILKTVKKLKCNFISITEINENQIHFSCGDCNFIETNLKGVRVPRNPEMNFGYEYQINSIELFNAIDLVNTKDDYSEFSSNYISGNLINVNIENKINVVKTENENPYSKISNDYLLDYKTPFSRCVKTAIVKIDKDFPISISGRGENDEYYEIMIAPRIESD